MAAAPGSGPAQSRARLMDFLTALTRKRAGFDPPGEAASEAALAPLARRAGLGSSWALIQAARSDPKSPLAMEMVEALAPRDTWFFRDRFPFRAFAEEILPRVSETAIAAGSPVRVWCAGSATGQEPYSISMLAEEARARGAKADVAILATDISRDALRRAATGLYDQFEVQRGLPIRRLVEHFEKDGDNWRIHAALRRRIDFRAANLLHDPAQPADAPLFDVVLLRHVLAHLTPAHRAAVLDRVIARLRPGGWLILGPSDHAEGALAPSDTPGLYRRLSRRADGAADRSARAA